MSLPKFTTNGNGETPTREEAINLILSSIAKEEVGLSNIINAESEKLQYALGTLEGVTGPAVPATIEDLLDLNKSIHLTLDSMMLNQFMLKEKMTNALTASTMQGPTGPAGPPGEPLETGSPLFNLSGTSGEVLPIGFSGELAFDSDSLDVTVETGPVIKLEISDESRLGTIIPFASGKSLGADSTLSGGLRNTCVILGYGNSSTFDAPTDLTASIILPQLSTADNHLAFSLPCDCTLKAMSFYFTGYEPSGFGSVTCVDTARLYYSDTEDDVYKPIPGAAISLETIGAVSGSVYREGVIDTLNVELAKGNKLLFMIDHTTPDYGAFTSMTAHWGGAIRLK